MGNLSHIGPRFGNAPVTVRHPVAKVGMPPKALMPAKPVTPPLLPSGWALRDYFYYGAAGVGTLLAAKSGYAVAGPSIGKLGSMLLGSKPPPLLPPPPLSPASQIYAKFTSALDYIKPLLRGTAVIGSGGVMALGASTLLKGGEKVASQDGGNAALIGATGSKTFTRKINTHKHKIRLRNGTGTVIGSRPRKVAGRLATTPIESPPIPSSSSSGTNRIASSGSSGSAYTIPQASPTSLSSTGDAYVSPERSSLPTPSEQNRGRSPSIQSENVHRERPSSLPPGSSHSTRLPETLRNRRGSLSEGLSGHLTNLLQHFSLPKPQEAPFRQTETPGPLTPTENLIHSPVSTSSHFSPETPQNLKNEAENSTDAPSRASSTGSSINIENNTATTEPFPMVDFLNSLDDNQNTSLISSVSNSLQNKQVEHSVRSSRKENQELLNQQSVPLTISENLEPLLTSNHSLPTKSNPSKGKEKELEQVKTSEPPPHLQWDSTKFPFPPEELSKKLEETGLSNSIDREPSSSTSSSASNSRANTGPIKMFEFWNDVDENTTPPVIPAKNSSGSRSPFIVSNPPSSTPSGYATPQGEISEMSSPTSSIGAALQNERGRSVSATPSVSVYATPRDLSPVRETQNHEQSAQDNVIPSSQARNSSVEAEKSKLLTSSKPTFVTYSTSLEDLKEKSSVIHPENHTQSGSSSSQASNNAIKAPTSTAIHRNNPPKNHDSELSNYNITSSRNPEDLRRIIEKGVSQKALTETLYRICCTYNNDDSYPLLAEVKMLLSAGARENAFDSLLALLRHNRIDAQAVELLLEAGADPRSIDYTGRNAMETLSRQYPMIITKPEERFSPRNYSEEKCTSLKNLLMTYADWHNALNAKDPQKLRNILNNNPDFKIPLAGNPTSSVAERLLFNPENSERIAQAFGQETPDFVKRVLNVPLDVDGFSKWARKTLHPPLSLRVVNQPELITGLQYCLGKTRKETEAFIQKAIEKEFHQDFEKVRDDTLVHFEPERLRFNELSAKHETPDRFIGPRADIKDLLAHEMADKAAQRVMDDIRQPSNTVE